MKKLGKIIITLTILIPLLNFLGCSSSEKTEPIKEISSLANSNLQGSCFAADSEISLHWMLTATENRTFLPLNENKEYYIELWNQSVKIYRVNNMFYSSGALTEPEYLKSIDIALYLANKFSLPESFKIESHVAILNQNRFILWRESRNSSNSMQGLLTLSDDGELVSICKGVYNIIDQ